MSAAFDERLEFERIQLEQLDELKAKLFGSLCAELLHCGHNVKETSKLIVMNDAAESVAKAVLSQS